jgi:hypothetical protein
MMSSAFEGQFQFKQDMTVTGCCYRKSPICRWFFPRVLVAILKMAEILCLYHYPFRSYQH